MVVADEMEQRMHERASPRVSHHVRTDDDVAELPRHAVGERCEPVDRESERVRRFVDAEMLPLQRATLVRPDERESKLPRAHALLGEHAPHELDRGRLVHLHARAIDDFDVDHRLRCVPVCSVWRLYASPMRWTSLWRTTSWWLNSTNAIPSTFARISRTWISPDACSRGRSTCVTSPVTTIFEPKPSRVRNICICSGEVFCASSRMMKLSFKVRPRI